MMSYDFGDIVLVPFPFTDQTGTKKRPAVIVSSAAYNIERLDVILMAVTSQRKSILSFGEIEIAEWSKAGLLKPSIIKPLQQPLRKNFCCVNLVNLNHRI